MENDNESTEQKLTMTFGKYKDWEIERIDDLDYLQWCVMKCKYLKLDVRRAINERIFQLLPDNRARYEPRRPAKKRR